MEKNIDLHIHSTYSDGELNLKDLVEGIKEKGVGTFAITDHDNIESYRHMKKLDIGDLNYIRGVELSTICDKYRLHLLGYDFNDNTCSMDNIATSIHQKRKDRVVEMIDFLNDTYNIKFQKCDIEKILSGNSSIGKPHVLGLLRNYGYGTDNRQIHAKYLNDFKSTIKYRTPIDDTIGAIKEANGFVILAHPKEVENDHNIDIRDIIEELIEHGIDGIEVYNSIHELRDVKKYLEIAQKYNLLISGGSDYHGIHVKPTVQIGNVTKEDMQIKQLTLVDKINNRRK